MRPRNRSKLSQGSPTKRRHKPDYMLLLITALLLSIGLIVVYAISPGLTVQKGVSANYFVVRQFIAIVIGLVVFTVVSKVPIKFFRKSTTLLLGASVISSLAVLVIGERVNGAYRWIQVGGISFQPVELIKFSLILWLAVFLVDRVRSREINNFDKTFKPLLITLGIVGFVVAGLQSDLGSASVIIAMMFAMSFVAGLPMKRILSLGVVILIGLVLAISTSAYRRDRVLTFLQPERDCIGAGYQTCQALIAVGSGGIVGQGLNSSGQAFGYLPEAANDSIFAIMAEKFGFLGMSLILGLFVLLYSRITRVLERTEDMESRLIVMGVLTWLSVQSIINIGAMIGLLPLKGITLPFISYGGTSVIFVSAAIGLVFNISRYTAFNVVNEEFTDVHQNRYQGRRMKLGYNGGNRR